MQFSKSEPFDKTRGGKIWQGVSNKIRNQMVTHGSNLTAIKVAEAQMAMDDGALELG